MSVTEEVTVIPQATVEKVMKQLVPFIPGSVYNLAAWAMLQDKFNTTRPVGDTDATPRDSTQYTQLAYQLYDRFQNIMANHRDTIEGGRLMGEALKNVLDGESP